MDNGILLGEPDSGGVSRRLTGVVRDALFGQRVRAVWVLAGLGWTIFTCFRVGLLIAMRDVLIDVNGSDIATCLLTGVRYDAVPIGFAMAPLVVGLSLAPPRAFGRKWFRRLIVGYGVGVTTLALFAETVGAAFFLHFGTRLNWVAMAYFGHFRESAIFIWNAYPVWPLAIGIVAVPCACWFVYRRVFWGGGGRLDGPAWARAIVAAGLIGGCVLAGRGGLDPHPLRGGSAYFSENNVINQITTNNFFTVTRAVLLQLKDNSDEGELYPFPSRTEAAVTAAGLILQSDDSPQAFRSNPLWRRTETGRERTDYNVVLIVMEGMAGSPVGALGNAETQTPNFDRLCEEGLLFRRMYAVGPRTARGMTGVLCGYPDLGGQSILKREPAQGAFLTLPRILRDRGYRTLFVYGGDPDFDNMRDFFGAGGIDTFIGETQLSAGREPGNWGLPDEVIFREGHKLFRRMDRKGRRFFAVILTVSNHEPFEVPLDKTAMLPHDTREHKHANAYRYADWALGDFFRMARKEKYFSRTIFVLVADHGRDLDRKPLIDVPGYRVPCLFYAPGIVPARTIDTVASQTDIAPTLLALLGGSYEHCFFGRNLLKVSPDDGFALLHEGDRLGWVRRDRALLLPPRQTPRMYRIDGPHMETIPARKLDQRERGLMQHEMLSYYETARQVYLNRSYRRPEAVRANGPAKAAR